MSQLVSNSSTICMWKHRVFSENPPIHHSTLNHRASSIAANWNKLLSHPARVWCMPNTSACVAHACILLYTTSRTSVTQQLVAVQCCQSTTLQQSQWQSGLNSSAAANCTLQHEHSSCRRPRHPAGTHANRRLIRLHAAMHATLQHSHLILCSGKLAQVCCEGAACCASAAVCCSLVEHSAAQPS